MRNGIWQSIGLDLVNINVNAQFYQSTPHNSRVMSHFRKLVTDGHTTSQTAYGRTHRATTVHTPKIDHDLLRSHAINLVLLNQFQLSPYKYQNSKNYNALYYLLYKLFISSKHAVFYLLGDRTAPGKAGGAGRL